ncbi:undecaprenyl-phosphate glucose phosphotransferase [Croceiramulus getboli]|nr:undecaprenyl-phosphate glucose phosphotransferase [Flavobacteriaceae bacterium YJPT1-3]
MTARVGRYSGLLRPFSYAVDLSILLGTAYWLIPESVEQVLFILIVVVSWVVSATYSRYYEVYRFTPLLRIIELLFRQCLFYVLTVCAYFGLFPEPSISALDLGYYALFVLLFLALYKLAVFYLLKQYRRVFKGNFRNVIIIGDTQKTQQLESFFLENPVYGYKFKRAFDPNASQDSVEEAIAFARANNIDELYCSLADLTDEELKQLVDYVDNNLKVLKFLPDNRQIFTKKLKYQYYGIHPILSLREIPLEQPFNQGVKRSFDVLCAVVMLLGVLSWLTPLIALAIRMDSKGPVFFKQRRNGLDYREFYCFKFRSMYPNDRAHVDQITKDDVRVTRVGQFLRKTSLDELPQFVNVLIGDMSVVGPRPHMVSHTEMYAERIDKFMVRHFVKPGITGLAQVSGYRGEVENEAHIINRLRYDIFYMENWSLLMDLRIIAKTIVKTLRGDDRAY